jgi:excisionase family DNA binding protein
MEGESHPPKRLIGVQQVAERLGCSTRHVWRILSAGLLPRPVKVGHLVRWSSTAIDEWIGKGCPPQK